MRRQILANCRCLIVKIGTRVLTRPDNTLDVERIAALVDGVVHWRRAGRRVAVVSSGAVGAGIGLLRWSERPADLARLQAVAALGQTHLIQTYDRALAERGLHAAQVLLTAEDLNRRASYLNVRNTLLTLWEMDIVPVINENDTVAVDELQTAFGDNDRLAGLVANLVGAPLIMLSDVEGLYDGDPRDPQSRVVPLVERWSESLEAWVRDRATGVSKGGMASKLKAAKMVAKAGEFAMIASGRAERVLQRILEGEPLGTLFSPDEKPVTHRKRWIGFSAPPRGHLVLDSGACRAICEQGRSLLAIGVVHVERDFQKGDVLSLRSPEGREVARGLSNYDSRALRVIQGKRSEQIAELLGHCPYEEVIHRDNLTVLSDG